MNMKSSKTTNKTSRHSTTRHLITTGVVAVALASSAILSGCGGISREQQGTIVGSVVGGVVGHQMGKGKGRTAMTIIGSVVGGMIGGNIAREMDRRDQQKVAQTLDTAPNYQKVSWDNQETNRQYTFTPINKYEGKVNNHRTVCRDYVMDAWIDGRMQQVKGRACKNNQGQWVNAS